MRMGTVQAKIGAGGIESQSSKQMRVKAGGKQSRNEKQSRSQQNKQIRNEETIWN